LNMGLLGKVAAVKVIKNQNEKKDEKKEEK
jgi:hypothetical protein